MCECCAGVSLSAPGRPNTGLIYTGTTTGVALSVESSRPYARSSRMKFTRRVAEQPVHPFVNNHFKSNQIKIGFIALKWYKYDDVVYTDASTNVYIFRATLRLGKKRTFVLFFPCLSFRAY